MRYSLPLLLVALCLLIPGAALLFPATAQDAANSLLPANAIWKHRWDHHHDGELKDPREVNLELSVRNNRITGKHDAGSLWTGEVVPGKVPLVMLRQDGPGYVVFYCGNLVTKGRIVGTMYSTSGVPGDFEIILE